MANKEKTKLKELKDQEKEEKFTELLKAKKYQENKYLELLESFLNASDKEAQEINNLMHFPQSRYVYKKLNNDDKKIYLQYYTILYNNASLINYNFQALENIFEFRMFWIRSIEDFKPKTKNVQRQFNELVHFLFSKYKLPNFAINIWKNITKQKHDLAWFLHIAEGHNLRKTDFLPFQLTNKHIHYMQTAPDDYTFTQAMVWGVLGTIDCGYHIREEICAHNVGRNGRNIEFWTTVFSFIKNNTFLERSQIRPLLDFIQHQKFRVNAPQPNFSMKNRNPATLMQEMEDWHEEARRIERINEKDRKKLNLKELPKKWDKTFATWEKLSLKGKPLDPSWTVQELNTLEELSDEGSTLHHCVRSYHSKCVSKFICILSLRKNGKSIVTLEMNRGLKEIVQARGFGNKKMSNLERSIVEEWAITENVDVGRML